MTSYIVGDGDGHAYVVVVPVGPECFDWGHRINRYDDALTCADCAQVAAQASLDGVDPDLAIDAFRAWNPLFEADLDQPSISAEEAEGIQDA